MVTPHITRTNMTPIETELLLSLAQCPEAAINVTGELGTHTFDTYTPAHDEITAIEVTKTMLMHDVRLIKYSLDERRKAVTGLKYLGLIVAGSTPDEDAWLTAKGLVTARQLLGIPEPVAAKASSPKAAAAAPSKSPAPVAPTAPATSTGRVVSVAPNPKRAGSASAVRYDLWQVGMSVEEALAAGLSKADIAHDTKKGFVVFG